MNLVEALQKANNDSREFIAELTSAAEAMGGFAANPGLAVSRTIHLALIEQAEAAIASGDVVKMIEAAAAHEIGD